MKKFIISVAIVMMMGLGASAQQNDAYFNDWGFNNRINSDAINPSALAIPAVMFGLEQNVNASPVGSGLVILSALGAGYAVARRNRKK